MDEPVLKIEIVPVELVPHRPEWGEMARAEIARLKAALGDVLVTVHHIGGHSKGLQSVRVKTRRGNVVLAADATHLYAHIDGGRVFPITYNVQEVVEGYETLKKLATSPHHVVPGHDPLVLARYPAAKPGLEGWIARLDAEPQRA